MKKIYFIAIVIWVIAACNSSDKGIPSTDSLHNDNIDQSDVNNRNLTRYDSSKVNGEFDSVSNSKKKDTLHP